MGLVVALSIMEYELALEGKTVPEGPFSSRVDPAAIEALA
jgi:hypothetical protein